MGGAQGRGNILEDQYNNTIKTLKLHSKKRWGVLDPSPPAPMVAPPLSVPDVPFSRSVDEPD